MVRLPSGNVDRRMLQGLQRRRQDLFKVLAVWVGAQVRARAPVTLLQLVVLAFVLKPGGVVRSKQMPARKGVAASSQGCGISAFAANPKQPIQRIRPRRN